MMEQPNRGKRSVGIDIGNPEGRELLYRLAAKSDVFLTNFLPDARARLRIDVEDIRAVNPKIIYVRGHGQGARGPDAEHGGYDAELVLVARRHRDALTPAGAAAPIMQRAAFGDGIGGMTVAGGIAAALFQRERTGEPAGVDVSLLGTAMWVLAPDIVASPAAGRDEALPTMTRKQNSNPVVNSYRTKDGRWLFLMMLQPTATGPTSARHRAPRAGRRPALPRHGRASRTARSASPSSTRSSPSARSTSGARRSTAWRGCGRRCRGRASC